MPQPTGPVTTLRQTSDERSGALPDGATFENSVEPTESPKEKAKVEATAPVGDNSEEDIPDETELVKDAEPTVPV